MYFVIYLIFGIFEKSEQFPYSSALQYAVKGNALIIVQILWNC